MNELEKYKCIVVEDEPIARKIMRNYIEQLPMLENLGEFRNAIEALEFINKVPLIDIVFLDINMPQLSGISLAKLIGKKTSIVFTTAYSNYAVESYEIGAVDYLLKPFTFERFTKAVFKILELNRLSKTASVKNDISTEDDNETIIIKSEGKKFHVSLNSIVYCEADKNYTTVVIKNGDKLTTLLALSKVESQLLNDSKDFVRVHRSFIVSKKYITAIAKSYLLLGEVKIPIGELYRESVDEILV
jgi:two-component system, LytTR family, response regulator